MVLSSAVLTVLAEAVPAAAAPTASLQDPATPYSHHTRTTSGRAVPTDSSGPGPGTGWNLTEQTSAPVHSGPNPGAGIPAATLTVESVEAQLPRRAASRSTR
jgi:hypothetical protein